MAKATKSIVKSSGPKPLLRSTGAVADVAATPSSLVVGFGASFTFGGKVVAVSTDDITKVTEGTFKFTLSAPVELGSVKDAYDAIRTSSIGQQIGMPVLPWDSNVFLQKFGSTTTTIDKFQIDTAAGILVLGLTFTFNLTLVAGVTMNSASVVINYKAASA
ncbi:MAG: hypothetical protein JWQ98_2865 [Chlorobi bacterium]|jgi:hypothetical protein|nr:hypothetical protein [Chlorobiota bacterium]